MLFLRLMKESALFALQALWVNKLRTFLSLLGITIGIFAIISVFTGIDSLESNIRTSIEKLGKNVIYIQKWPWTFGPNYPWWKYWNRPLPDLDEVDQIRKRSQTAKEIAFQASSSQTIKYRNSSAEDVDILAISHAFGRIQSLEFSRGRYFSEIESDAGRNVVILGANIAESLFTGKDAIGLNVKIFGRNLQVIGVLKKEGESMFDTGMDNNAMVPIGWARSVTDIRSDRVNPFIMVQAREGVPNHELIGELEGIMRSIRKLRPGEEDNFALNEANLLTKNFEGIFDMIGIVGFIIGGFSILVGGIGIANIMFVSVKERTPLIGIQKAIGAKNHFILMQFLLEAVTLCMVGGLLGLLLVFAGAGLVTWLTGMSLALTWGNIVFGLGISASIGVVFGFIPALMAARMNPVDAIRA